MKTAYLALLAGVLMLSAAEAGDKTMSKRVTALMSALNVEQASDKALPSPKERGLSVLKFKKTESLRPKISEVALKKKGTGSFSVGILGLSFQTMINHVEPLFLFGPFTQKIPFDAKIFGLWTQGSLVVISCDHDKCES